MEGTLVLLLVGAELVAEVDVDVDAGGVFRVWC